MRKIKIVADSSSDLPKEIVEELGVDIIPLVVACEGREYLDGVTITAREIYEQSIDGALFTTSQCSINALKEHFSTLAREGYDIIYIAIASTLSGCYSAGVLAKDMVGGDFPDIRIGVIDSMAGSMALGWAVIRAAEMVNDGCGFDEIMQAVETSREGFHHYITVDDLTALIRGGRIPKSVGFLANTLNIKPIITVIDGMMVPYPKGAKQRGMKKCISKMLDIISEEVVVNERTKIAVCHAYDTEKTKMFIKSFEERFGRGIDIDTQLGCSIGVHGGPTAFAVFIDDYDARRSPKVH